LERQYEPNTAHQGFRGQTALATLKKKCGFKEAQMAYLTNGFIISRIVLRINVGCTTSNPRRFFRIL